MSYFVLPAAIVIVATALSFACNETIAKTIPMSLSLLIVLVFVCGVADCLSASLFLVFAVCIIALLYIVWKIFTRKNELFTQLRLVFNPALMIYLCASVFVAVYTSGLLMCYYDEFSHWGMIVKDIFIHGELCAQAANDIFVNYPPGLALIEWAAVVCNGCFDEALLYYAYGLFGISFLLIVFERELHKLDIPAVLAKMAVTIFVPFVFFNHMWSNLQVDALLGILFFFVCFVWFIRKEGKDLYDDALISAGFCMLTLVKDAGFALGCLIGGGVFLYRFIYSDRKKDALLSGTIYFLPNVMIKLVWEFFWKSRGTSEITAQNIFSDDRGLAYYSSIAKEFWNTTFKPLIQLDFITINLYQLLFGVLIIAILVLWLEQENKRKLAYLLATSIVTLLLYTAGILYMYMTTLPYETAMEIPSFVRYQATPFLGMVLLFTCALIDELKKNKTLMCGGCIAILAVCIIFGGENARTSRSEHLLAQEDRKAYASLEAFNFTQEDKIYVISQNQSVAYYITNYIVAPAKVQECYLGKINEKPQYIYRLGKALEGNPEYTSWDISCDEWSAYLADNSFDYVYIYSSDEYFADTYGSVFQDGVREKEVYRVSLLDSGIQLIACEVHL